jgi:hypothetical protein
MNYQKFIFGLFLLIIPLIILVLFYKNYVYNYCKNDISCLKEKLIYNLNNLGRKINNNEVIHKLPKPSVILPDHTKDGDRIIHSFGKSSGLASGQALLGSAENEHFTGIADWFMGPSTTQLPISSTNLEQKSLNALEKKIADKPHISSTFPPSDEIPDLDNKEFLAQIDNKPYLKNTNTMKNTVLSLVDKAPGGITPSFVVNDSTEASQQPNKLNQELPPATPAIPTKVNIPKPDEIIRSYISPDSIDVTSKQAILGASEKLSPFGKCNFFNDKCPEDHHPLGNFSIGGLGNNTILQCGKVQNGKNGSAVAIIRNNSIHDIHITDQGHGYNPSSPPKVTIEGGKGTGAKAEAIVDDNGFLKVINVKNQGYNYVDTPIITIESPYINSSCHLCCKN